MYVRRAAHAGLWVNRGGHSWYWIPCQDQRVTHVQADTDLKRREITDNELPGGAFCVLRFQRGARCQMDAAIDLGQYRPISGGQD